MINRRKFCTDVLILLAGGLFFPKIAFADNKNLTLTERIIEAESNGNPNAYRKDTDATGLMQITPYGALADWNKYNPSKIYKLEDMFNPELNVLVGEWYLEKITGHYLHHYELDPHEPNILASWNMGPTAHAKYVGDAIENFSKLPSQTREFIKQVTRENYT